MKIVQATNGIPRKRQLKMAETLIKAFKSGGNQSEMVNLKYEFKSEMFTELLNIPKLLGEFGKQKGQHVDGEILLQNRNATQVLWANMTMAEHLLLSIIEKKETDFHNELIMNFLKESFTEFIFPMNMYLSTMNLKSTVPEEIALKQAICVECLGLLEAYSKLINAYLTLLKNFKNDTQQLLFESLVLVENIDFLMGFKIGNLTIDNQNLIFLPTADTIYNEYVCKIKNSVFRCAVFMMSYYVRFGKAALVNQRHNPVQLEKYKNMKNKVEMHFNSIIKLGVHSLLSFYKRPSTDLEAITENTELQDMIITMMKILLYGTHLYEVFGSIEPLQRDLLIDVFFFNSLTTQLEKENTKENPSDFLNNAFMIIEANEQFDATIKLGSVDCIEEFSKKMDGFLFRTINLLTNTITICLGLQTLEQLGTVQEREDTITLTNSRFWKENSIEDKIDAFLLILTRLYELVEHRHDLYDRIQVFFNAVSRKLTIECPNEIIQSRMMLFMGYYVEILFSEPTEEIINTIKWVIGNLNVEGLIGLTAEDLLKNFQSSQLFINHYELFGTMIWESIFIKLATEPPCHFYDFILDFVEQFPLFFDKYPNLIEKLLEVLVTSLQKYAQGTADSPPIKITNRIWNIIRRLSDLPGYYLKYKDMIEKYVSSLFPLIERMECKFNYDEDIVDCVISWTENTKSVSDTSLSLIKYFKGIQMKQKGKLEKLHIILNNFLLYAKARFSLSDVQDVLEMAYQCIKPPADASTHNYGETVAEGFLLIQLIIFNLRDVIDIQTVENIITVFKEFYTVKHTDILKMYEHSENDEFFLKDNGNTNYFTQIYFEKMIGVFLMCVYLFPNPTLKHFFIFEEAVEISPNHQILRFTYLINLLGSRIGELFP